MSNNPSAPTPIPITDPDEGYGRYGVQHRDTDDGMPTGLEAWHAGVAAGWGVTRWNVTARMVRLVIAGRLRVSPLQIETGPFKRERDTWRVEPGQSVSLPEVDENLARTFFATGPDATLWAARKKLHGPMRRMRTQIRREATMTGVRRRGAGLWEAVQGFGLACGSVVVAALLAKKGLPTALVIGAAILGVALFLVGHLMGKRMEAGTPTRARLAVQGVHWRVTSVQRGGFAGPAGPALFTTMLPWAISLGEVDVWCAAYARFCHAYAHDGAMNAQIAESLMWFRDQSAASGMSGAVSNEVLVRQVQEFVWDVYRVVDAMYDEEERRSRRSNNT